MHVLSDTIEKAETTLKLLKIDPLNKNIHKLPDAFDVSMGANLSIYKKSEKRKGSLVLNFHEGVILLPSNITAHMIKKCPLKCQSVKCASCLNPNILTLSPKNKSSKLKFSKMLVKLTALKQISIKLADDAEEQLSKFIDEHVFENGEKFSSFAKFDQRLDTFMSQFLLNKEYESLWEVCIIVFCLSHGQSAVESGFKANKEFVIQNQSEDSLKSLRIINDHLTLENVQVRNITITQDMIKSVKAARECYKIYLNEKQKSKAKTDKDLKQN